MKTLANFTTNKQAKVREAFLSLGIPHHDNVGRITITSSQRGIVRRFLNGLGIPATAYESASLDLLEDCFNAGDHDKGFRCVPFLTLLGADGWTDDEASDGAALALSRIENTLCPEFMTLDQAKQYCSLPPSDNQDTEPMEYTPSASRRFRQKFWSQCPTENRIYLNVSRNQKEEAKELNALFDADRKLWFVDDRAGFSTAALRKFGKLDNETPDPVPSPQEPADQAKPTDDVAAAITNAITGALAGLNTSGGLDEGRVIQLINEHAKPRFTVQIDNGKDAPKEITDMHHHAMPAILEGLAAGLNVLVVGPAGSGKTTIGEQCAEALGIPFHFTGAIDTEYKLSGFIDAQGRCINTGFRDAYENGGLFLFDEIDGSLPGACLWFNAALANGVCPFPDGMVRRHDDFRCMAAANTYLMGADRQYVGRNQIDAASVDRFVFIDMGYDEDLELVLAGEDQKDWTKYVQSIRAKTAKAKVRHVISPRASIAGAKLLRRGALSRTQVEEMVIWKGMDDATRQKVLAA